MKLTRSKKHLRSQRYRRRDTNKRARKRKKAHEPHRYLARTSSRPGVYESEHGYHPPSARLKWLISTCCAGLVGVGVLSVVLYGARNMEDGGGMVKSFQSAFNRSMKPFQPKTEQNPVIQAAFGKTDRLPTSSRGLSTKYIIHDSIVQRRGNREFIAIKPYALVVSTLATQAKIDKNIPHFNPFRLYANMKPIGQTSQNSYIRNNRFGVDVKTQLVSFTKFVPAQDENLALSDQQIRRLVAVEIQEQNATITLNQEISREISKKDQEQQLDGQPNTTVLKKNIIIPQEDELEGLQHHAAGIGADDTIESILENAGVRPWNAKAITEAMTPVYNPLNIKQGQTMRMMLVPSPTNHKVMDPIRISLYEAGRHIVSVVRDSIGDFIASSQNDYGLLMDRIKQGNRPKRLSLYTSLYESGLGQKLPTDLIMKILRIHAYDTDYKQRVAPGDDMELFFNVAGDGKGNDDGKLKELLYTALTVGGRKHQFYRFRTPDGTIDYYDNKGNNSKKFLMLRPVRGGNARFTSGFGWRMHPILRRRKLHKGVDWAARPGTPILSAGNGIIEEAKRTSGYGNYVRIRHANGYKTAYAHMRRFANGVRRGVKVRQGQIIGYVGSTGLSSGPHLHFEVHVNNTPVNPMRINVPRGRQLKGKLLAKFLKEKQRIDELMKRTPVKTQVANKSEG